MQPAAVVLAASPEVPLSFHFLPYHCFKQQPAVWLIHLLLEPRIPLELVFSDLEDYRNNLLTAQGLNRAGNRMASTAEHTQPWTIFSGLYLLSSVTLVQCFLLHLTHSIAHCEVEATNTLQVQLRA